MTESSIEEKSLAIKRYLEMNQSLMAELRLVHSPVAVKFFYTQTEFEYFRENYHYNVATKPMTFCQCEHKACEQGQTLYSELKDLQCDRAACSFGKEENNEVISPSRQYLSSKVFGIALAPLGEAQFIADTITFYCDSKQADMLINAWVTVSGVPPFRTDDAADSSSCSSSIYVHNKNIASIGMVCSSSGDGEKWGGMNVILPADHLRHTVDQLLSGKMSLRGSSFSRPGDGVFRYVEYK